MLDGSIGSSRVFGDSRLYGIVTGRLTLSDRSALVFVFALWPFDLGSFAHTPHSANLYPAQNACRISRTDLTFCVVYNAVAETPNRIGSTSHSERRASPSAENNAHRFRSCDRMGVEFCRWSDSSPRHISTCKNAQPRQIDRRKKQNPSVVRWNEVALHLASLGQRGVAVPRPVYPVRQAWLLLRHCHCVA
jgi:hypothetical protein